jgi:hypothetical protein
MVYIRAGAAKRTHPCRGSGDPGGIIRFGAADCPTGEIGIPINLWGFIKDPTEPTHWKKGAGVAFSNGFLVQ